MAASSAPGGMSPFSRIPCLCLIYYCFSAGCPRRYLGSATHSPSRPHPGNGVVRIGLTEAQNKQTDKYVLLPSSRVPGTGRVSSP